MVAGVSSHEPEPSLHWKLKPNPAEGMHTYIYMWVLGLGFRVYIHMFFWVGLGQQGFVGWQALDQTYAVFRVSVLANVVCWMLGL